MVELWRVTFEHLGGEYFEGFIGHSLISRSKVWPARSLACIRQCAEVSSSSRELQLMAHFLSSLAQMSSPAADNTHLNSRGKSASTNRLCKYGIHCLQTQHRAAEDFMDEEYMCDMQAEHPELHEVC